MIILMQFKIMCVIKFIIIIVIKKVHTREEHLYPGKRMPQPEIVLFFFHSTADNGRTKGNSEHNTLLKFYVEFL